MKLKLFIITLIAISFSVIGLLVGCGGNSKNSGGGVVDEPRDQTIKIGTSWSSQYFMSYLYHLNGAYVGVLKTNDAAEIKSICVSKDPSNMPFDMVHIYLVSNTVDICQFVCRDSDDYYDEVDFTATSSKPSVVSVAELSADIWSVTSHNPGEATINITIADNRKTWIKVTVVSSTADLPPLD